MTTASNQNDNNSPVFTNTQIQDGLSQLERAIEGLEMRWFDSNDVEKTCSVGSHPVKIGSGPKCEIRLTGQGFQPLHAVVSRDQHGIVIRRWGANTLLNGETFQESRLSHGDQITVGIAENSTVLISIVDQQIATETTDDLSNDLSDEKAFDESSLPELTPTEVAVEETVEHQSVEEQLEKSTYDQVASPSPEVEVNLPTEDFPLHSEIEVASDVNHELESSSMNPSDIWAIESYTDQDSLLGKIESTEPVVDQEPESTETWLLRDQLLTEVESVETSEAIEVTSFEKSSSHEPTEDALSETTAAPKRSPDIELASQVSRERLTNNYLRVKRLVQALKADRALLVETNQKIELFAEQLDLLHQQMTDSSNQNTALNQRIVELESQLEAVYGNQEETHAVSTDSALEETEETVDASHEHWQDHEVTEATFTSHEEEFRDETPEVSETTSHDEPHELSYQGTSVEEPVQDETSEIWDVEQTIETDSQGIATDLEAGTFEEEVDESVASELASDATDLPVGSLLAEFQNETTQPEELEAATLQQDSVPSEGIDLFDAPNEPAKDPFQPASFIEQFSQFVPEEEAEQNVEPLSPPSLPEATLLPQEEPANSFHENDGSEEEESVDDYMAKMMARIRGDSSPEMPRAVDAQVKQVRTAPIQLDLDKTEKQKVEEVAPTGPPITNLSELKSNDAPEVNTDMAALRNLANSSARSAIEIARSRQFKEKLTSKIMVIGLGFFGSVIGIITSPNLFGIQFVLSACFATMWGYIAMQSLLRAQTDATLDVDFSQASSQQASTEE